MSRFAGRIVKRYGATEQAFRIFMEEAGKCNPPLDDDELGKIWASAQRFAVKIQGQPGYVPPEKYKPECTLRPSDFTDVGQAKVLSKDCANELAFTTGTDFLVYDGKRWVESKSKAMGCMVKFLDRQLEDARKAVAEAKQKLLDTGVPEDEIAAGCKDLAKAVKNSQQLEACDKYMSALSYRSFALKRRDIKYINGALTAVKPMVEIATTDLDSHEFLLNCPDGTYDLRKGMAGRREHDPADYITQITAFA